jgi:hypothetical protein
MIASISPRTLKPNDAAFHLQPRRWRAPAEDRYFGPLASPFVVRTFCVKCGTPLTYLHDESPDTIDVTTATLEVPEAFPPNREIWLEHRIGWEPLDENLQHFQRGSPEGSGGAG